MNTETANVTQAKPLILVDENGLTPPQLEAAKKLAEKFPRIVEAGKQVLDTEKTYVDKYLNLCVAMRDSGLNGKELSTLLRSIGFRKQRVTELKKVISVSPELWEKFVNRVIGFKGVLQIARDGEGTQAVGESGETEGHDSPAAAGAKKKLAASIPKDLQGDIVACIEAGEDAKKANKKTWIKETGKSPFKFVYESPEFRYVVKISITSRK